MKVVIDDKIRRVDEVMFGIFRYINLIRHVNPVNVEEEKEAFFSCEKHNPTFRYKPPRGNLQDLKNTLLALDIPSHELGMVYQRLRDQFLKQCIIIENIGVDDNIVRDLTSQIYGWPSEHLVAYAKEILKSVKINPVKYKVPSEVLAGSLQKMFDEIGLYDWSIMFSEKWFTSTKNIKRISICENRLFSDLDVHRLPVHEVGVHAVRYANAYLQPLHIFVFGFPDFLSTEEGLATLFEEATGNMNPMYFRNYAGRVIAVDCLHRNLDFRGCFMVMKDYGFSDDDAWNLCVRVYRGGGFVKDHVYLEGYVKVKKFYEGGGDLKKLLLGKVGIEDIGVLDYMLAKKLINPSRYLPPFIK